MPLNKFVPLSPDPYITSDPEMTLAKFGHLNTIVDYLNAYVVVDSLQLAGSGPITATARYISDSTGVNSVISISTIAVGIGTTAPIANLQVNGTQVITNADITGYNLYSSFNLVRNGGTSIALDRFTGAPHFNFRAAGGTIASPTTQVGELGNIGWWSHSGTAFNRNVLLLARAENFVGGLAQTQRLSIGMGDSGSGTDYYYEMVNGNSYFGPSAYGSTPTARVQIKGSGSTSATTSLLVQNSAGTELFKVRDDGYVNISAGGGMNISGLSFSGLTYNGVINFGNNDLSIGCDVGSRRVNLYSGNTNVLTVYKSATNYGVGISDSGSEYPTSSAVLQVSSITRGFLKPKMTTAQKNAIVTPTAGLEIYDTDLNRPCFYNGSAWVTL
jgi:hypothetical protein